MEPKIAAASLVLAVANFEGLMPAWPRVLITELSEHFGVPRAEIAVGMATLCTLYRTD